MEITLFETCINLIQSIMIALFLRSLITKPKGKHLVFYTTGYAIIEFMYIQWMNSIIGFDGGMFEFFDTLFCFIYFSISSHQSIFEKVTLSILPTSVITLVGVPMQFSLYLIFGSNWMEVMMNYRFLYIIFGNLCIFILFWMISKIHKQFYTYFNDKIYILLSTSILISAIFLTLFQDLVHNSINKLTLLLCLLSFILLIINIIIIFMTIIHNQLTLEKAKAQYTLDKETSFLNSQIQEKERYLNELKHNVNLFLSLLKSDASKSELQKKAPLLESVNQIDTIPPVIQSIAFATALPHAKKLAKENNITIKTAYFCSSDFDVSEPDLYLLFSTLFETIILHTIPDSTISVDVKELNPSCKITVIFQRKKNEKTQVELPESMMRIIKANHGDYILSNRDELWNYSIFLPLKRKERRKDEQG